ncbi:storkhead-box protein 1-like isoform X1 [Xiphias gladius]|uniref:storkhead-box protein 1-like isoform X1 n=1 Tax=Xiphias gladius TaxID=8245 RepID=UPI001A98173E|nr:storkhead-box protein 1-like isoform X1 [Xiphias gladius]
MEKFIQIAPHSLALVLSQVCGDEDDDDDEDEEDSPSSPAVLSVQLQHHTGYEVFANFKAVNMQHFWNKALTHALSEIFFLGWIDEHVLLIQGKEVHLQVLRNGWTRRTLKPPQGFDIECIVVSHGVSVEGCQIFRSDAGVFSVHVTDSQSSSMWCLSASDLE